jgi:hypothetical protein
MSAKTQPDDPYGFEAYKQMVESNPWSKHNNENSAKNLLDNKPKAMSAAAKKRLRTAINWLYVLTKVKSVYMPDLDKNIRFRLNMITLTLCADQFHDDRYIKSQMLEPFLQRLKRKHGMKSYLWRAERQKNGRIHFHITTNIFIHHADARKYWNDIQAAHGYIDRYIATGGNSNPNGTDVHSIYKIKNLAGYLCKYMSKDVDADVKPIEGRQWFLSSNLSGLEAIQETFEGDLRAEVERYTDKSKWLIHDYAQVLYADIFTANLKDFPLLRALKNAAITKYSPLVN